ncbi:response regulator [Candidatus Aerophobetes bacterium]|uniref:Two-component system response regulator n=1 Tax=Aerophobetes bacterium TaxID=2030807 RepID=A0A662DBL0_UNCAE|nr:response regulator [Candidatus Aerophobetes bacterium]RLE11703.1 MAG: two-component system response regulator [Candidatus Aerophobetes bacterium]
MGKNISNILIVDDSVTMRKIIKHHLTQLGYNSIIEASNGKEGLKKVVEEKIDLIICDWNMPEMNGLQFLYNLRENWQEIPVIMLTTVNTQDEVIAAMKAGANSYLTKPFTRDSLKEKIEQIKTK